MTVSRLSLYSYAMLSFIAIHTTR